MAEDAEAHVPRLGWGIYPDMHLDRVVAETARNRPGVTGASSAAVCLGGMPLMPVA